ncbi:DUF4124 domain-containing protein, partial [Lysobacter antibioticus]
MRAPSILAALFCLTALIAAAAQAGKLYRWTDRQGIVHYGDRAPDKAPPAEVERLAFRAEPGAIARLRVLQEGERYLAWADNTLAG